MSAWELKAKTQNKLVFYENNNKKKTTDTVELLFLWTLLSLFLSVLSVGLTFCWAGFYWDIRDILCWIFNEAHEVHEVQDLSIALLLSAFLTVYKVNHSVCVPLFHIHTHTHTTNRVAFVYVESLKSHPLTTYWFGIDFDFWVVDGYLNNVNSPNFRSCTDTEESRRKYGRNEF